jgi:hypothetical protein
MSGLSFVKKKSIRVSVGAAVAMVEQPNGAEQARVRDSAAKRTLAGEHRSGTRDHRRAAERGHDCCDSRW